LPSMDDLEDKILMTALAYRDRQEQYTEDALVAEHPSAGREEIKAALRRLEKRGKLAGVPLYYFPPDS
jgi:hypothetical protein